MDDEERAETRSPSTHPATSIPGAKSRERLRVRAEYRLVRAEARWLVVVESVERRSSSLRKREKKRPLGPRRSGPSATSNFNPKLTLSPHFVVPTSDRLSSSSLASALLLQINEHDHHPNRTATSRNDAASLQPLNPPLRPPRALPSANRPQCRLLRAPSRDARHQGEDVEL